MVGIDWVGVLRMQIKILTTELRSDTLDEWFDPEGTYRSPQKSFLLLLALAGVTGVSSEVIT